MNVLSPALRWSHPARNQPHCRCQRIVMIITADHRQHRRDDPRQFIAET
jgi:hypothetical protein